MVGFVMNSHSVCGGGGDVGVGGLHDALPDL